MSSLFKNFTIVLLLYVLFITSILITWNYSWLGFLIRIYFPTNLLSWIYKIILIILFLRHLIILLKLRTLRALMLSLVIRNLLHLHIIFKPLGWILIILLYVLIRRSRLNSILVKLLSIISIWIWIEFSWLALLGIWGILRG